MLGIWHRLCSCCSGLPLQLERTLHLGSAERQTVLTRADNRGERHMPVYYPIFLDLAQRRCLVVGGGIVAERKVCGLLEAEAAVVVVSPSVTTALRRWASQGAITHISRAFRDEDVEGCALIIAATDREEVNRHVALAARRRRIWVNTVDTPAACDFIAPAVVRRG